MTPAVRGVVLGPPGWVPRGFQSGIAIDFPNDRYWGTRRESVVCSRASVAYGETNSGLWIPFAANTPTITDKGVAVWEGRTNVALWCRDLTNAAWTKMDVTAALDQTGIDGVSASASSITATAGNGTCLQAITLASSARYQTAFVKRLTGSGVVEMTTDNGATWTAITVTSSWSRVSIPTQTLANPTVGFRIVTSGDAIAVDFVQNENGVFATSPILTTTGSAARAADVLTLTQNLQLSGQYTFIAQVTPGANNTSATNQFILCLDDTSASNRAFLYRVNSSALMGSFSVLAGVTTANVASVLATEQNSSGRLAARFALADFALSLNGAEVVRSSGLGGGGTVIPTPLTIHLGCSQSATSQFNGMISLIGIAPAVGAADDQLRTV